MISTISPVIVRLDVRAPARRPRPRPRLAIALLIALALLCNSHRLGVTLTAVAAVDAVAAAHFLEQATFGPSPADVALVESGGREAWLDAQFALPESPMPDELDTNQVRNQLFANMANGSDQLRQRMMFALSQIIVISANKNGSGAELIPWVRLLSRNAFGNYRTLLREVTVSPTMGKYLDLVYSRKASATSAPNENYPREMLQLFTLGLWRLNQDGTVVLGPGGQPIPTYTQTDVAEIARALTGWTYPTKPGATPTNSNPSYFVGEMLPRVATHDAGAKAFLDGAVLPAGQSAEQDLEAVLDHVFQHPNLPPFIATRLIRSLVTSNPSPGYIARVANAFANNGAGVRGDLRATLTAILLDPEAASFSVTAGRLKDPILDVIGLGRALGAAMGDPSPFMYVFGNLSQRPLTPGSVFSFYSPLALLPGHNDLFGPEFQIYPPALAIQRANFIYGLLNGQYGTAFGLDLTPFTDQAANVPALVELVNQRLMFGRMTPELRDLLVTATTAVPVSDVRQRALGALYLAAISSEYSVYADNAGGAATTGLQPPTGLAVQSIAGNVVTLAWRAPMFGPAPTSYIFSGGVHPGEVLVRLPTGSAAPVVSFTAPPGSFYVRIQSVSGGIVSRASSEIRIHVNVPTGPTAPANLLGVVKESSVGLSWRNTFGGGAPSSMMLDVTGALSLSIPLPVTETFTFPSVPPGTYKFSVRAINAAGSSGSSNTVTLTFPTKCSGSPQVPANLVVAKTGNVLSASWQAAASGAAATSYLLNVTGTYNLSVPLTARALRGAVPAGIYNVSVRAVNACGRSGATAVQTIAVP